MNRVIRCGAWIALALCGLLISATVDKVPDSPAELKQLIRPSAFSCDHQARPGVDPVRIPVRETDVHDFILSWRLRPQSGDALKRLTQPQFLRLAADSSPPAAVS